MDSTSSRQIRVPRQCNSDLDREEIAYALQFASDCLRALSSEVLERMDDRPTSRMSTVHPDTRRGLGDVLHILNDVANAVRATH